MGKTIAPKRKTLEAPIKARCVAYAKSKGWQHIRFHFGKGAGKGWPDDLFLKHPGRALWVEFKRPGEEPEPIQQYRLGVLQGMAFAATFCDDFETFKDWLQCT